MAKQYERVEPTPFDAPGKAVPGVPGSAPTPPGATAEARPGWLLPALGGLGMLALAVVFVLPRLVSTEPVPGTPPSAATPPGTVSPTGPSNAAETPARESSAASPFADAVAAKARAAAQEMLAELLDVQENLRNRGAEEWASDEMNAIAAAALAGDERYRERDFEPAMGHYERALAQALALEQSLPGRFEAFLAAGVSAIEALQLEPATQALVQAERLEPEAPEAVTLRTRVNALPALVEDYERASQAEQSGDLEAAVSAMRSARDTDPAHSRVASELARLELQLNQQRFNAAMSEGYAALDAGDFSRAEARFERAAKLQSGSSEAATALQELAAARTVATLNRLQGKAEALVAAEDWSAAIPVLEEALGIDASLRFAREGLALARPRAALGKALDAILEKPARLVDDAILREARNTLDEARAQPAPGPRLREQIAAVEETLAIASTPLQVLVRSDGLTEVTVYKVARLGLFEERQLTLRPGTYTAVGSRRGYRDARIEFTVGPDNAAPVYIACSEAI